MNSAAPSSSSTTALSANCRANVPHWLLRKWIITATSDADVGTRQGRVIPFQETQLFVESYINVAQRSILHRRQSGLSGFQAESLWNKHHLICHLVLVLACLFIHFFLKEGNCRDEELQLIFLPCASGFSFRKPLQGFLGPYYLLRFSVVFSPGHWEPDETEAVLPLRNSRKDTHTHHVCIISPMTHSRKERSKNDWTCKTLKFSPSRPFPPTKTLFFSYCTPSFPCQWRWFSWR